MAVQRGSDAGGPQGGLTSSKIHAQLAQTPCPAHLAAQGAQVERKKKVYGKIQLIKQTPRGCHSLTSRALAADLSSASNV